MTEDQMNPNICPSALEEDGTLDREKWDGAHKWYDTRDERTGEKVIECAECGIRYDKEVHDDIPTCDICGWLAIVNRQEVVMEWRILNGAYMQPGLIVATGSYNDHYCDEHENT